MMMKTLPILSSGLLLCALPLNGQEIDTDHAPIEIQFRYQPGKTYETKMVNMTTTKMNIAGQQINTNQTMTMEYKMEVETIEDSENLDVTMTYTRLAMDMNTMGQKTAFDSENPDSLENNPMAGIAGMVGKSVTMTMTPDFDITEIKGMDKLFDGMGPGGAMAKGMFTDDQLKQMMGAQMEAMMPDKKVKAGDQWKYEMETPLGPMGTMAMDGLNTLEGVAERPEGEVAIIKYQAKGTAKAAEGPNALPMKMDVEKMEMEGGYEFNLAEGYVSKMTMTADMSMSMAQPGGGEKMTVPSTTKVTMTTTMK